MFHFPFPLSLALSFILFLPSPSVSFLHFLLFLFFFSFFSSSTSFSPSIRSLENAAQTERTNPPAIVRPGTISLVLNSTQASPLLNEIQGCFPSFNAEAGRAEKKTRAFGRLWLIRLPIFLFFLSPLRLIFPTIFRDSEKNEKF